MIVLGAQKREAAGMTANLKWPHVPLKDRLAAKRIGSRPAKFLSLRHVRDLQERCQRVFDEGKPA